MYHHPYQNYVCNVMNTCGRLMAGNKTEKLERLKLKLKAAKRAEAAMILGLG